MGAQGLGNSKSSTLPQAYFFFAARAAKPRPAPEVNLSRPRAIPTKRSRERACILRGLETACYVLIKSQTKWRATGRSKDNFGQRFSWAPLAFTRSRQRKPSPTLAFAGSFRPASKVPVHPLRLGARAAPQLPSSGGKRQTPPARFARLR